MVIVCVTVLSRVPAEIVLVNEVVGGAETAGYLLKYDSIHGTWWVLSMWYLTNSPDTRGELWMH